MKKQQKHKKNIKTSTKKLKNHLKSQKSPKTQQKTTSNLKKNPRKDKNKNSDARGNDQKPLREWLITMLQNQSKLKGETQNETHHARTGRHPYREAGAY